MDRLREMVRLHRLGSTTREVARLLKMSPNTEREYRQALLAAGLLIGSPTDLPELEALKAAVREHHPPPEKPTHERSSIAEWRPHIEGLMDKGLGPKTAHRRMLELHPEFEGTYPQVKRLMRAIRRDKGIDPSEVAIPVETAPAEVAQVDFGFVGRLVDPETRTLRKAWCFVMVLGYSRKMVTRVVFDQKIETWLRLHVEAFAELGGVPQRVRPDNLKAAVIRAAFAVDDPHELNRSYRELARHYGFKVDPAPPYAPEKKGKVESAVKYVKRSFFVGREEEAIDSVREKLARWTHTIANVRVHGTTREVPEQVFEMRERHCLTSLPPRPFEMVSWRKAKVHQNCHAYFEGREYSAPWRLVGSEVWLRITRASVTIYADDTRIVTHDRRGPGPRSTVESHLPEPRARLRRRDRGFWLDEAARLGPEARQLAEEIFDADDVLYQVRVVQSVLPLLAELPPHRVAAVCRRASFYGVTTFGGIKKVVARGLDLEPLPTATMPSTGVLSAPRFARNLEELAAIAGMEAPDEPH
jgi:transposase